MQRGPRQRTAAEVGVAPPPGAERDRFVDLVRAASIVAVVAGHWLITQLTWARGALALSSSLGAAQQLWPLTWVLQVIPLFFFVGGFVDLRAWQARERRGWGYAAFLDRRVHRLLGPLLVFLAVVCAVSVAIAVSHDRSHGAAGPLLLQPVWFLGVYVIVVALTPLTLAWHRRHGWWAIVALVVAVGVVDWLRLGVRLDAVGYLNVLAVWVLVHQLGYCYADGTLSRPRAAVLAGAGLAAATLLVALGPYPARMVGVPGDPLVNMNPPTAALTALALAQVGLVVLLRDVVAPALRRPRLWRAVVLVNLSIMTIYLWHQPVLALVARLALPLGLPQPAPASAAWWVTRPLWFALAGGVLALVTVTLSRFEHVAAPRPAPRGRATTVAAVVAVALLGPGLLGLAGTDPTSMLRVSRALGRVDVAPVLGLALVVVAAAVLRAVRTGARAARRTMLAGGAVLATLAALYGVGAGSLAHSPRLAALALGCAAVPLVGALAARDDESK